MGAIGRLAVATAATAVLAFPARPAAADEPGESDEARLLALQAIALIVNTPDEMHEIEERIEHAMEAPHKEGVDLEGVEQAMSALDEGDLQRTRELLQTAIGAGPFVSEGVPEPVGETSGEPGQPAYVGAEAGTTVVLDEFRPDTGLDGGDIVVLAIAVATMAAGALMAWWFRPPESVRQLRREAAASKGP